MAQGIIGADLELEMKNYVASMVTSSTTSLSSSDVSALGSQKSVRCPICLMKYKDPRRLACEHTFCKDCLQAVLKGQKRDKTLLKCLICQEPAQLHHPESVEDLDKAVISSNIETAHKSFSRNEIQCSKCSGRLCSCCVHVVCNKCGKYVSTMHCRTCKKSVCTRCTREHTQHLLVEIETEHEMLRQKKREEEEEEEWERGSGSSKDSGGSANQYYSVNIEDSEEDYINEGEEGMVAAIKVNPHSYALNNNNDNDLSQSLDEEEGRRSGNSSKDSDGEVTQSYAINDIGNDSEEERSPTNSQGSSGGPTGCYTVTHDEEELRVRDEEVQDDDDDEESNNELERNIIRNQVHQEHDPSITDDDDDDDDDDDIPDHIEANVIVAGGRYEERGRETEETDESTSSIDEDGPDRPPTMIDDDEFDLNERVNETVQVNPVLLRRLQPSAPSNEKRQSKIVLVPKPIEMEELDGPPRYREIRSMKWCARITFGLVIVLVFCIFAFGGLALTAFFLSPRNTDTFVSEGELVLLSRLKPFWSRDLTVTSIGPYDSPYNYQTELYLLDCDNLVTSSVAYSVFSSGSQLSSATDLTADIPTAPNSSYAYLISGSTLSFNITIISDTTYRECASELNIYENYDDFINEDGLKAVQTNCINIRKPSSAQSPTIVTFSSTKDSFYFVTVFVPPSASYHVNVSVEKIFYTNSSLMNTNDCTLRSTRSNALDVYECSFSLLTDFVIDLNEKCVLAETTPLPPYSSPSVVKLSLLAEPNIFRNIAYAVIPSPLLVYLVACLIVWICYKGCVICCYKVSKRSRLYMTAI
ncbi:PREDICTED: uncharacterized protein LOC109580756 isoform X1 [Amphimedon queenslandica]|uniref:RING-type domain-containing protein n=1 Tax=Amphimedon queenslandica TaxID=400682 RepID=A0AAN0IZ65_AMPQE|nr:PREDICTED: uncharacterized protein LOC109580756 isoform X1 [Amphimedon queenslandica]|eukprot:XP_019849817.1 PREDICTED: uncharacterized protein LOC109580756 isoform X1 [Amphimedon queenslandica]